MEKVNKPENRLKAKIGDQTKKSAEELKKKIKKSKSSDDNQESDILMEIKELLNSGVNYAKQNPLKTLAGAAVGLYLLRMRTTRRLMSFAARSAATTGVGYVASSLLDTKADINHESHSTLH